ncbi:MAG TPA: serine/threonine-protein kinase [Rubrobacteraceae bacterium]|nr:serine/threonine-protein kinase [Rubrobacteraceae bacterium]
MLEREIGSGGMARVFLGRDEVLDRAVAVKILRHGYGDSDIGARFRREGRTAAGLSHPNIVQVYDAGEAEFEGKESSYIVMEYLSGGDLKDLIDEKGSMRTGDLAKLGAQVAAGLAHAHERGVIHRDIKPHNILLDEHGRPKLTDFGIARALDATTTSHPTRTGAYLGTALYSSPEQLQGEKVTPKSDVYSLGATLYQAATGEPPFSGSALSVASQHVSKPPPPPRELNGSIGAPMEALILECLAKDPDERPSAEEVQSRLAGIDSEAEDTRLYAAPLPEQPTRQNNQEEATQAAPVRDISRNRLRTLLAILALLVILALVAAIALPALLGGNGGNGQSADKPNGGKPSNSAKSSGSSGNNSPQATTPAKQETTQQPSPPKSEKTTEPTQPKGLTAQAAEQTIRDHYAVAASDNYQDAWNFLSTGYQQRLGSRESWTSQFQDLESVEFTDGPTAKVNGDTVTVTFSTIARHTNRTDRPSLTATLVDQNGEWKIDSLN